jgi:hypothetical protein
MASNIKLGARPKNFVRTVTFALPEGGEGRIACTYRYRTRIQSSPAMPATSSTPWTAGIWTKSST